MSVPFSPVANAASAGPLSSTVSAPLGPSGYLNAVDVDAAGKHVYVVGSPTVALQYAGVALAAPVAQGTIASGTILARCTPLALHPPNHAASCLARALAAVLSLA